MRLIFRYTAIKPIFFCNILSLSYQLISFITAGKDGSTVGTVRYGSVFAKKYGLLVRYEFFVMVRVRYVDTLFEFAY